MFSSASGFASYLFLLRGIDYMLWIMVLVGGVLGGFTGSYLMNRIRTQYMRFVIMLIIAFVLGKILISIL